MQGVNTWSFAPYKPFLFDTGDIYICRLYPGEGKIGLDWLPLEKAGIYTVVWKKRGAFCWYDMNMHENKFSGIRGIFQSLAEITGDKPTQQQEESEDADEWDDEELE